MSDTDKAWQMLTLYAKRLAEAAERKMLPLCQTNLGLIKDCVEALDDEESMVLFRRFHLQGEGQ